MKETVHKMYIIVRINYNTFVKFPVFTIENVTYEKYHIFLSLKCEFHSNLCIRHNNMFVGHHVYLYYFILHKYAVMIIYNFLYVWLYNEQHHTYHE